MSKRRNLRIRNGIAERYCVPCDTWKAWTLEYFGPHLCTPEGLNTTCRDCIRERQNGGGTKAEIRSALKKEGIL